MQSSEVRPFFVYLVTNLITEKVYVGKTKRGETTCN